MKENELKLKQLIAEGQARIIYIGGTGRSGSTIAQIIFARFADRAIHQPFKGLLAKAQRNSDFEQIEFDADIYEQACGLIVEHIFEVLQEKEQATILVKELSDFFDPPIWQRWIEIPEKFIFTINDPHLQYFSGLSLIVDQVYQGNGELKDRRSFVLAKTSIFESKKYDNFAKQFEGTILEYNDLLWQKTRSYLEQVRKIIEGTPKKLAVLDLTLVRNNPEYTIAQTIAQLDFAQLDVKAIDPTSLAESQTKIVDVLDRNRLSVRKASNSQEIYPLKSGEAIGLSAFGTESQKHINRIIPLYLEMFYAAEQVAMPALEKLDSSLTNLAAKNPFVAYAIAKYYQQQKIAPQREFNNLIDRIIKGNNQDDVNSESQNANQNLEQFSDSFTAIDKFWNAQARN